MPNVLANVKQGNPVCESWHCCSTAHSTGARARRGSGGVGSLIRCDWLDRTGKCADVGGESLYGRSRRASTRSVIGGDAMNTGDVLQQKIRGAPREICRFFRRDARLIARPPAPIHSHPSDAMKFWELTCHNHALGNRTARIELQNLASAACCSTMAGMSSSPSCSSILLFALQGFCNAMNLTESIDGRLSSAATRSRR